MSDDEKQSFYTIDGFVRHKKDILNGVFEFISYADGIFCFAHSKINRFTIDKKMRQLISGNYSQN